MLQAIGRKTPAIPEAGPEWRKAASFLAALRIQEAVFPRPINSRRSRSIAFMANMDLFISRVAKWRRTWRVLVPAGPASPKQTVPTGLSGVPPPGPAMPDTERP